MITERLVLNEGDIESAIEVLSTPSYVPFDKSAQELALFVSKELYGKEVVAPLEFYRMALQHARSGGHPSNGDDIRAITYTSCPDAFADAVIEYMVRICDVLSRPKQSKLAIF